MSSQITASNKTDGYAITGTIVGDKKALDVNIESGTVNIDTTGLATETTLGNIYNDVEFLLGTVVEDGDPIFPDMLMVGGSDGTNSRRLKTDASGELQIDVLSSALPSGAATSSNQTSGAQKTQLVDAAGDVVDVVTLNVAPVGSEKGLLTQSIIHGLSSGGGGTYIDVKVNPAGKLLVTADLEQGGVAVGAANPVQVTLANTGANATAVKVDGSATTQPVSGTVAATQSGTWTLGANSGVDIGDVTINNASGASAVNIQDGGNSITVDGSVTVTQGTATNLKAQAEVYQGGVAVGAAAPLQVSLANHGANATAVKVDGSAVTQPVSGTVSITANSAVNVAQINGVTPLMGNGATGTGSQRVTIASDNTAFNVNSNSTAIASETSLAKLTQTQGSTTSGQSGPLVQGAVTTAAPSYSTGNTNPLSLTTGGALRTQIDNSPTVFTRPSPTSSSTSALATAESTAYATNLVVKASAGRLYAISGYNSKASDQFIQIHNTTSLPADASVPKRILRVYADSNFFFDFGEFGLYCATGITVCNSTTGPTKTIGAADIWFQADYT